MKKHVIVVNTAARIGGALTILKQFIGGISRCSSKDIIYHIFVSVDLSEYASENIDIIVIDRGSSYFNRALKEKRFLRQWCKANNVKPSLLISMQNIASGVFRDIPQLVYLHQSLSIRKDLKWNIFKKDERIFWFYRNVYDKLIKLSLNKRTDVIVQAKWIKEAVVKCFSIQEANVHVVRPEVQHIDISKVEKIPIEEDHLKLFYPTNNMKYKNYDMLLDVLLILQNDIEMNQNFKLYLTLNENDINNKELLDKVKDKVVFLGSLPFKDILKYYNTVDILVFPSFVETFGLPLLEASAFGVEIIASDLPFSHEALRGYPHVRYENFERSYEWAEAIKELAQGTHTKDAFFYEDNSNGWQDMFDLIKKKII